jgi:YbbR domain-containing protein
MTVLTWLGKNLRTYLWALALSVSVWIAAVTSADPDEARLYPNPVKVEIVGQDPGLVIKTEIPETVEVVLRAPRSVWASLEADPTSVRALLDLSGLSNGEHVRDLQIQVGVRPVRIVSVLPGDVDFTLEPLASRTLDISLSLAGEPAIGYQAGDPTLEPSEVIVSGASSLVDSVNRVRLSVSLDGVRESIDGSLPIEPLDEKGQRITGLSVTPASVHVSLPISQQGGYRDLAVKVDVRGQPASGYRLTNITVFPPLVTVYATEPELVNSLPGVLQTLPLDISNVIDNTTTRLGLNLPPGISVVGEQSVLVQAGVAPIETSFTLPDENIEIIGLTSEMAVQFSPKTVDVIISGPLPLLQTLSSRDVHVTIDVTGLLPGTYRRTPDVEIQVADVAVESIQPSTIEVVLAKSNSPTATPRP